MQIGSGNWLRTPIGTLDTDLYIPLYPVVKDLIDGWLANQPALQATEH